MEPVIRREEKKKHLLKWLSIFQGERFCFRISADWGFWNPTGPKQDLEDFLGVTIMYDFPQGLILGLPNSPLLRLLMI